MTYTTLSYSEMMVIVSAKGRAIEEICASAYSSNFHDLNFRNWIFLAHQTIETRLEQLVVEKIVLVAKASNSSTDFEKLEADTIGLMSDTKFNNKARLARSLEILTPDEAARSMELNKLRNCFAHTGDGRYKKYLQKENYVEALSKTLEILSEIISKKIGDSPLWKKEYFREDEIPF